MGKLAGRAVIIASLAMLTAGCSVGGTDRPPAPTDTSTTTATGSPTARPTPTETVTLSGPAPTASHRGKSSQPGSTPTSLPTEVGAYADAFIRAWGIGDRAGAGAYANDAATASLFDSLDSGGATWKRSGVTDEGRRARVTYADGTGLLLHVLVDDDRVEDGSSDGVIGVEFESQGPVTDFPTTVGAYADAFVRAWGVDAGALDDYATDDVVETLYADFGAGGSYWQRTSTHGSTVEYRNTDGTILELTLDETTVSAGDGGAVIGADFH